MAEAPRPAAAAEPLDLVPRYRNQGYAPADVERRRRWLEAKAGCRLEHVGSGSVAGEAMRGNVENPIGVAQVPLGVAGPLLVHGEHAQGLFYVPLATTEGALVRSYERGMVALTRAGGAEVRVHRDENRVTPVFWFDDVVAALAFPAWLEERLEAIRAAAEATTRHGRLLRVVCRPLGREVLAEFAYATGDASGMNMITRATEQACAWIVGRGGATGFHIFSGAESEKRASGAALAGGKGKTVVAGARLAAPLLRAVLHTDGAGLTAVWRRTVLGHLQSGALGYNGQLANGLAALFIACGQDVANVANAAVGLTVFEALADGGVYASVTLPSLTVATVGGGTARGTARECLELLGCAGRGGAPKLAEITAATLLAGELSMGAAIAAGELVAAHETLGRNRP